MKWTVTILKMTHEILYFVKLYNVFMKLTNMGKSTILVVFIIWQKKADWSEASSDASRQKIQNFIFAAYAFCFNRLKLTA